MHIRIEGVNKLTENMPLTRKKKETSTKKRKRKKSNQNGIVIGKQNIAAFSIELIWTTLFHCAQSSDFFAYA